MFNVIFKLALASAVVASFPAAQAADDTFPNRVKTIDHPSYGRIVVPESPLRYAAFDNVPYSPSVELGSDTRDILVNRLHMDAATADAIIAESRS
jgi:crotonobetainyl-CoA:carnitine CoA-transferase CaiB-like acyl-CoA transferase